MKIKPLNLVISTLIVVFIALYSIPLNKNVDLVISWVQWKIDNEYYSEKNHYIYKRNLQQLSTKKRYIQRGYYY